VCIATVSESKVRIVVTERAE